MGGEAAHCQLTAPSMTVPYAPRAKGSRPCGLAWRMAYGTCLWHMVAHGTWPMAYGVWAMAYGHMPNMAPAIGAGVQMLNPP